MMTAVGRIVAILSLVFMIVNVQSCSRVIDSAKDNCTLAINNLRRVGSSSIACQPGECRDQLRDRFANGACLYNFYTEETVNDICSGKYDCNSVTLDDPMFTSDDDTKRSSNDIRSLRGEGCLSGINNLRTFGSRNNDACSDRCLQFIESRLSTFFSTLNTYTLEEVTDYCTGRYDNVCGGSSTTKGLPLMVFLVALLIYYCL